MSFKLKVPVKVAFIGPILTLILKKKFFFFFFKLLTAVDTFF